jgi:hypothetical protein
MVVGCCELGVGHVTSDGSAPASRVNVELGDPHSRVPFILMLVHIGLNCA